jgi:hypothetical protein
VQVRAGDVLTLGVSATDTGGGASEPREATVEVVSPEELENKLQQQMSRLREDLSILRRTQRKTVGAVRELKTAVAASGPDPGAVRRSRDLQVDQGRVAADLGRFLGGIARVFDGYVLNRRGSEPTLDRVLPLYEEALALPPGDSGEAFPPSLYERILAEKRANRLYDPEILGALLDVLDLGDEVKSQRAPAAYDALERFGDETTAGVATLEEAERAAAEVLSGLDRIDERMQRFEDLGELIRITREIRDTQGGLATDPRTKSPERSK